MTIENLKGLKKVPIYSYTPRPRTRLPPMDLHLAELTSRFGAVYRAVSIRLSQYVSRSLLLGRATPRSLAWYADLIPLFFREFKQWERPRHPEIAAYLGIFHQKKIPPLVRLAAHVYLHIAFDLPIVISEQLPPLSPTELLQCQLLHQGATPAFREALRDSRRVFGWPERLLRILPFYDSAVATLTQWALALRATAWIHAEIMASPYSNRGHLRNRLARAVRLAAEEIQAKMPPDPPSIWPQVLALTPGGKWVAATIALAIASGALFSGRAAARQVKAISRLGEAVMRYSNLAILSEASLPNPTRVSPESE